MTEPDVTDGTLARRVGDGDERALEEIFHLHNVAVRSAAGRVLRDHALAEDVVQETFTTLWDAPEKYRTELGSLRSYLVTIAHRRAVDMVRSQVARARREDQPPEPARASVEEEVWSRTVSGSVRRALSELPDQEREAVTLAYLHGLSYTEVARHLGQPEGTVKSRIRKAMRRLAASLAEEVRPEGA